MFLAEGCQGLLRFDPGWLREDIPQLGSHRRLLFPRDIGPDVLELVFEAPLPGSLRKLGVERIQHSLMTINSPKPNRLHPTALEIFKEHFSGELVFTLTDGEGQNLPFPSRRDSDYRQNRHLLAFPVVDHGKVRAIREGV